MRCKINSLKATPKWKCMHRLHRHVVDIKIQEVSKTELSLAKMFTSSSHRSLKTNLSLYQISRLTMPFHHIWFSPSLSSHEAVREFCHKGRTAFFLACPSRIYLSLLANLMCIIYRSLKGIVRWNHVLDMV